MSHLASTFFLEGVIFAGVAAIIVGWADFARTISDRAGLRTVGAAISLALLTASALLFVTFATYNALIGRDRNGSQTALLFIRTGNYLSLLATVVGLTGNGKGRWATLGGGIAFLFLWFSEGMGL